MNTHAANPSLRSAPSQPGTPSAPAAGEAQAETVETVETVETKETEAKESHLEAHGIPVESNLAQLFRERTNRYGDLVRWRQRSGKEWRRATYRENQRLVNRVISGLDALGARPGDAIGILSGTRWEWMVADWAITGLGAFTATLYATLTPETIAFILHDAGARYVFVDTAQQYQKVRSVREQLPHLEKIVIFDEDARALSDPMVISFSALLKLSTRSETEADAFAVERAAQIQPEDCAGLIYTSGTTGRPKGVVMTHRMLLTVLAAAHSKLTTVHPGIIDVLWLPLAHGMGRLEHMFTLEFGGETVVVPSVLQLMRDLGEIRPDMMLTVPRLLEKVHAGMIERAEALPAPQRALFHWALGVGERTIPLREKGSPLPYVLRAQWAVADRLVFRRLREVFGGRVQLVISGGAPIDPSVVRFYHAIGIPLLEAWGLTETTTVLTLNKIDWFRVGTVGTVFPGHEIRIAPDGEILVRGPCIFPHYLNNPEATAEALDAEGWLHTGDIGTLDQNGFLTIIDRKKDILVTTGGDKIAPQHVEIMLNTIPVVAQACVYGDRKPYAVALLTLDWAAVREWASGHGIKTTEIHQVARSPEMRAYLDAEVAAINSRLQIFERVKSYAILTDDFTLENGLLTPTQKIRRRQVYERYRPQFEQLYETALANARPGATPGTP